MALGLEEEAGIMRESKNKTAKEMRTIIRKDAGSCPSVWRLRSRRRQRNAPAWERKEEEEEDDNEDKKEMSFQCLLWEEGGEVKDARKRSVCYGKEGR